MNNSAPLSLVSIDKDGCIRVASTGNLTTANISFTPKNPLESVLGTTWASNRIILDLSKTDFMDSTAIAWLIATTKQSQTSGGSIAIHSIAPRARQMLDILKIGKVIPLVANEAAARQFLTGAGPAVQAA